jgi:long-subunit fatty acid transport protein
MKNILSETITDLRGAGHITHDSSPRRLSSFLLIALTATIVFPATLQAAGREFAAGGTRGLGRGGASFLRADDPGVMVLNPAMLSDLPSNMAMIGLSFNFLNACILPSGNLGWQTNSEDAFVLDKNGEPLYYGAQPGDVNAATGKSLTAGISSEPLPKSCYSGGVQPTPSLGGSFRLGEKLGVGLGVFPPDDMTSGLFKNSWGNGDGTVDTPNGKRPDITRYSQQPMKLTYLGLLLGAGYRIAPWLRFGLGLRWTMVVVDADNYSQVDTANMSPQSTNLTKAHGKDLFIPGFVTSIHAVPIDALDIGASFRWEDRIQLNDSELDVTTRMWGWDKDLSVTSADGTSKTVLSNTPPMTTKGLPADIENPPIFVPQLTLGIRYADRIRPRNYELRKNSGERLHDSMNDERWDIEANFVYSFNSVTDQSVVTTDMAHNLIYFTGAAGTVNPYQIGVCPEGKLAADGVTCNTNKREIVTKFGGKNQWGVRLGGDANIIPGLLSLRLGGSFDSRGINPDHALAQNMNFQRIGVHAGATIRIAKNTDISVGYAHFFFETIEVQFNENDTPPLVIYAKDQATADKYNIKVDYQNGAPVLRKLDGVAQEPYYATNIKSSPNAYINAGTYTAHLDVLGLTVAHHF